LRLIVIIFAYYYNSINQLLYFSGAGLCKDVKTIRNYENAWYAGVYRKVVVFYILYSVCHSASVLNNNGVLI